MQHDITDLEIAIEEGATIVRVGTSVFGVRPTPDRYYWNEHAWRRRAQYFIRWPT